MEDDNSVRCEGCRKVIHPGDLAASGGDSIWLCEECAPTFADMLKEPEGFCDDDYTPLSPEAAQAIVDVHLAAGGALTDKMVSPY